MKWLNKSLKIAPYVAPGDSISSFEIVGGPDNTAIAHLEGTELLSSDTTSMAVPVTDEFVEWLTVSAANNATKSHSISAICAALKDALQSSVLHLDSQENAFSRATLTNTAALAHKYLAQKYSSFHHTPIDDVACVSGIPDKYELVGDVLMIAEGRLQGPLWEALLAHPEGAAELWSGLAALFGARRVARKAAVDRGPMRESRVRLVHPVAASSITSTAGPDSQGWVVVVENGISFGFDITRVMFCSGNVTERMRMGRPSMAMGETVVDLYCGVGYYTLPLLVHGQAGRVHACEWNPNSTAALRANLHAAGVQDRCEVHEGDNRSSSEGLVDVADRVLLGLLPSSVAGWPLAARALKPSGGVIHVHENVVDKDLSQWVEETVKVFGDLLRDKPLTVRASHLEKVKSYAPHVLHVVLDLDCHYQ